MMKSVLLLSLAVLASPAFAGDAPTKKSAKEVVFTKLFNEADIDGNGILDEEEFANSHGASNRPVITEIRFDELASLIKTKSARGVIIVPTERGIFLDDFIEAKGGRSIKPDKAEIFDAADNNNDGFIDFEEFPATRVEPAASEASVFKAFDKLDKNDDGLISPSEWGLNVKV